jgi:hypothetical protein
VKKSINFEGAGGIARHASGLYFFYFIIIYLNLYIFIYSKREKGKGKIMGPLPN